MEIAKKCQRFLKRVLGKTDTTLTRKVAAVFTHGLAVGVGSMDDELCYISDASTDCNALEKKQCSTIESFIYSFFFLSTATTYSLSLGHFTLSLVLSLELLNYWYKDILQ